MEWGVAVWGGQEFSLTHVAHSVEISSGQLEPGVWGKGHIKKLHLGIMGI